MKYSLPYINNAKAILVTIAINLAVFLVFDWSYGIGIRGVIADSIICAFITTIIDIWFVYACLKKIRAAGQMPRQVPVNRLMQMLPKNPFALGLCFALSFAALIIGINWVILSFFDLYSMGFAPWLVYKLIYTTVLSIKIVEFCIFRYVQPDWANAIQGSTNSEAVCQPVKSPFPKISLFKEMYGGVTMNLVMNILMGSFLGSVITQADGSIVLLPTTIEGIPITGLIFGLIMGVLISHGVIKSMNAYILAGGHAAIQIACNKLFTWMPKRKGSLMCLVTISVMLFSAVALPSIMYLFGKSVLNFLQFTIFITLYATLISKPLSYVLIRRCLQKDYINRITHS